MNENMWMTGPILEASRKNLSTEEQVNDQIRRMMDSNAIMYSGADPEAWEEFKDLAEFVKKEILAGFISIKDGMNKLGSKAQAILGEKGNAHGKGMYMDAAKERERRLKTWGTEKPLDRSNLPPRSWDDGKGGVEPAFPQATAATPSDNMGSILEILQKSGAVGLKSHLSNKSSADLAGLAKIFNIANNGLRTTELIDAIIASADKKLHQGLKLAGDSKPTQSGGNSKYAGLGELTNILQQQGAEAAKIYLNKKSIQDLNDLAKAFRIKVVNPNFAALVDQIIGAANTELNRGSVFLKSGKPDPVVQPTPTIGFDASKFKFSKPLSKPAPVAAPTVDQNVQEIARLLSSLDARSLGVLRQAIDLLGR